MNKSIKILIKGLVILKSILIVVALISSIAVGSELYGTRNQIEGRELIESTPTELFSLIAFLFVLSMTLLFDIRTLKLKNELVFKQWIRLLIFTILGIAISFIFKIQWFGITLMLVIGFYAFYLLSKYQKA